MVLEGKQAGSQVADSRSVADLLVPLGRRRLNVDVDGLRRALLRWIGLLIPLIPLIGSVVLRVALPCCHKGVMQGHAAVSFKNGLHTSYKNRQKFLPVEGTGLFGRPGCLAAVQRLRALWEAQERAKSFPWTSAQQSCQVNGIKMSDQKPDRIGRFLTCS